MWCQVYHVIAHVSTHSRLKAAGDVSDETLAKLDVSTHSRLKAAGAIDRHFPALPIVSTHSRLKAAGPKQIGILDKKTGFNTQPPKGGWL